MNMNISKIFSKRNMILVAFILVVLFLGTVVNFKVGSETFVEGGPGHTTTPNATTSAKPTTTPNATTSATTTPKYTGA